MTPKTNLSKSSEEKNIKKQVKIDKIQAQITKLENQYETCTVGEKKEKILLKIDALNRKIRAIKGNRLLTPDTKNDLIAYSFIAPNFIGFAIFTLIPMIFAFALGFMSWDGNNPISFVGLKNFIHLFEDSRFKIAFINTLVYSVATVPLTLVMALGLAIVLNQKIIGRSFFRTISFFPYVASLVAVAAVWNMIFSPGAGIINVLLTHLGVAKANLPKWSADPNWAMFTVVLFSVWKSMGYYMVIYLAGLQGISAELYEAASIDGATGLRKFLSITWPQLKPTTFFVVIMLTINSFKVYDQIYMLTQGGPGTSTLVLVYHIYQTAFVTSTDYGYASAISMVLFAIVLIITLVQFRIERSYANS